jgi:hypothetical protein
VHPGPEGEPLPPAALQSRFATAGVSIAGHTTTAAVSDMETTAAAPVLATGAEVQAIGMPVSVGSQLVVLGMATALAALVCVLCLRSARKRRQQHLLGDNQQLEVAARYGDDGHSDNALVTGSQAVVLAYAARDSDVASLTTETNRLTDFNPVVTVEQRRPTRLLGPGAVAAVPPPPPTHRP